MLNKSILIIILLLLTGMYKLQAQNINDTINPSHSAMGVYAGANGTAAFTDTKGYTRNSFVSFSYGIYGAFDISSKWRVEVSINYISYGCKYLKTAKMFHQHDTLFAEGQYSTFAAYASGALLFKYLLDKKNSLVMGAHFSKMVISDTHDYAGYYNDNKFVTTQVLDEKNYLVQTTPLLNPGIALGYEYTPLPRIGIAILFNSDLLPVMKSDQFDKSVVINNYNRSLQLRLSYALFN